MKHFYAVFFFIYFIFSGQLVFAQNDCPAGTFCGVKKSAFDGTFTPSENFQRTLTLTGCGIKYATSHAVLGKRYSNSQAVNQPTSLSFNQFPCSSDVVIEKAYLYWMIERGQAVGSSSLSFSNPSNQAQNINGTLIGSYRQGRCWACDYTEHFRADVTPYFTGNGSYSISGLPQNLICTNGDTDGIVLVVVYRDRTAGEEGTFVLYDGIMLSASGTFNQTVSGFNVCQTPISAEGFAVIGDFQDNAPGPWSVKMGGTTYPVTPRFFNVEKHPVGLSSGDRSILIQVTANADCFSWIASGVYFQTGCNPNCVANHNGTLSANATLCTGQTPNALTLSGYNGTVLRWESSTDGGNTWNNINYTGNSYTPPTPNISTHYRVAIQGGNCGTSYSSEVTITVIPNNNNGGTVSQDTELCPQQNPPILTLAGNNGNVIRWEKAVNCSGNWENIVHTTTQYQPVGITTTTCYRAVVSSGQCPAVPSGQARISFLPAAIGGNLNQATLCEGNTTQMTLTGYSGTIQRWERAESCTFQGSWQVINHTLANYTTPNLTSNTCFRVWVSVGNCPPIVSGTGLVTIVPQSLGGNITGQTFVCSGATPSILTLAGQRGAVLRWESSTDCPNFSNPQNISNTTADYQPPQLFQKTCYRAVVQNNPCGMVLSPIWTINVRQTGNAGTLSQNQTICSGNSPNPLNLLGNTTSVVRWQSSIDLGVSWQNINHTQTTYAPPNLTQRTTFRVEVADSFCGTIFTNAITIVTDLPTIAGNVSSSQTLCSGGSGYLLLSGHQGDILYWESSTDGGQTWNTIAHTSANYSAQNLTQTTVFRAKVRRGICPPVASESATVTIIANGQSGVLASDVTLCRAPNQTVLTLSNFTGNIIRWEKSENNGNSWQTVVNTSATLTVNNLSLTTRYRVGVQSPPCPLMWSNEITISVLSDTITGTLTSNQTVCDGGTIQPLELTNISGVVIRWEVSTNGGNTWASINNTTTSYLPSFILGERYFRAIVSNGNCPALPTPFVRVRGMNTDGNGILTGGTSVCAGGSSLLTLTQYSGNIIRWEKSTDNEQTWTTIAHNGSLYTATNITQAAAFRVVIALQGCPNNYSSVVRINVMPNAVAGMVSGEGDICFGTVSPELTLTGQTANIIRWESSRQCPAFTSPTFIPVTTATYRPPNLTVTTCFRAVVQMANCDPVYSPPVMIQVFQPAQSGTIYGNASVCNGANVMMTLLGNMGQILRWEKSEDQFTNFENISHTLDYLQAVSVRQNICYRAVVKSGICPEVKTQPFCITVSDSSRSSILSENKTICYGESGGNLLLSGYFGNILSWERSSDGFQNIISVPHQQANYPVPNLTVTTCFRVWVQNGNCTGVVSNTVCINVISSSSGGNITGTQEVCASQANTNLTLSGQVGNLIHWEQSSDQFATMTTLPPDGNSLSVQNLTQNTCYRAKIQNDRCPSVYSSVHCVQVVPVTLAGNITAPNEVCIIQASGTLTLSGHRGNILYWQRSQNDFQTSEIINTTLSNVSFNNLTQKTCYRAMIRNGICPAETTNVACVNVVSLPVGGMVNPSQTVCTGSVALPLVLMGQMGTILRWESSTDNFMSVTSIQHTLMEYQPLLLTQRTCFRAVMSNGICGFVSSVPACINVEVSPQSGYVSETKTVCLASNSGTLKLKNYEGTIIRWERSEDDFQTIITINNLTDTYYFQNLNRKTSFRVVVQRGVCSAVYSLPATITVTQPKIALTIQPIQCRDDNNAVITAHITEGIKPYIIQWSKNGRLISGDTVIRNLEQGFYCLYVKDAIGCEEMQCVTITNPPLLTLELQSTQNLSCYNSSDGKILLSVTGGVSPYRYTWSDGLNHTDFGDFSAGTYAVTVTDVGGCQRMLSGITLTQPKEIISQLSYIQHVRCNGNATGAIGQHIYGGDPPYTYQWSHGATTEDVEHLTAGIYSYTATDTRGCKISGTYVVTQPLPLMINVVSAEPPSCNNSNDGKIMVEIMGGTPYYFYSWSTGVYGTFKSTLNNLPAGDYELMVRDAYGCMTRKVITLTAPPKLQVENIRIISETCNGANDAQIHFEITGGSGNKSFLWNDDKTTSFRTQLKSGNYSVKIRDEKGCEIIQTFEVKALAKIQAEANYIRAVSCNGGNDGAIGHNILGGNPPYQYIWSNGVRKEDLERLTAGSYTLTVTDAKNCTAIFSYIISQPESITINLLQTIPPRCAGQANGRISVQVTGGTLPYRYLWSNGSLSPMPNNLKAGTHTVYITDAKNCRASASFTLTEPQPINVALKQQKNLTCGNDLSGMLEVKVSGGIPPYLYLWSNGKTTPKISNLAGGNYWLLVLDQNGCAVMKTYTVHQNPPIQLTKTAIQGTECRNPNSGSIALTFSGGTPPLRYQWAHGDTSEDLGQIPAGTYFLTVTDVLGCIRKDTFIIPSNSSLVLESLRVDSITCTRPNSGIIALKISSGTFPYRYQWFKDGQLMPQNITFFAGNLTAGKYTIIVTDAKGCILTQIVELKPALPIKVNVLTLVAPDCENPLGRINVNASGGKSPYQYMWSDGKTTPQRDSLIGGTYFLRIRDAQGCEKDTSFNLPNHNIISAQILSLNQPTCANPNGGKIQIYVTGGVTPLTYLWSDGNENLNRMNLTAGNYTLTITDRQGCRLILPITLNQSENSLAIQLARYKNPNCYLNDGYLIVSASGGVTPYRYTWSNGWNSPINGNLSSGTYYLTVTDANGCQKRDTFTLIDPVPRLILTRTEYQPVICNRASTGGIKPIITGGTPLYTYKWSNGAITPELNNLRAGNYSLTVTDAQGCRLIASFSLSEPAPLVSTVLDTRTATCPTCTDGEIRVRATGGTSPYRYRLENGVWQNNGDFFGLLGGQNYRIEIQDSLGCSTINNVYLNVIQPCHTPFAPQVNPSANSGLVYWQTVIGVWDYILSYRTLPNGNWVNITVSGLTQSYRILNLLPNMNYEIRIKAMCENESSVWSEVTAFRTLNSKESVINLSDTDILIYPNPAKEELNIYFPIQIDSITEIQIIDLSGRVIYRTVKETDIEKREIKLNLTGLTSGVYFLRISIWEQEVGYRQMKLMID